MIVMLLSACHAVAVRPPLSVPGAMNSELPLKGLAPGTQSAPQTLLSGRLVLLPVPGRGRSRLTEERAGTAAWEAPRAARPLVETDTHWFPSELRRQKKE
jgi:hypothetical protein